MHQVFQLTSSRRGWQLWSIHWNSERGISTHILTKRMTMTEKGRRTWNFYFNSHPHEEDDDSLRLLNCHADISTHILTKRMTITAVFFQKTTDISTHILTKRMTHSLNIEVNCENISTHILTKRMTLVKHWIETFKLQFQLTSSRRGWRIFWWCCRSCIYFNSHPHEEDDSNFKQK